MLVAVEHGLYGCAIFTTGLGRFLYPELTKTLQLDVKDIAENPHTGYMIKLP